MTLTIAVYIGLGVAVGFCLAAAVGATILWHKDKRSETTTNLQADKVSGYERAGNNPAHPSDTEEKPYVAGPAFQRAYIDEVRRIQELLMENPDYAKTLERSKATQQRFAIISLVTLGGQLRQASVSNEEAEVLARRDKDFEQELQKIVENYREVV